MSQRTRLRRTSYLLLIAVTLLTLLCLCPHGAFATESQEDPYGPIVGINLGSVNSRIAVFRDGEVEMIDTIPSLSPNAYPQPLDVMREEAISQLFQNLKERADAYLGDNVTHTVVTIPERYGNAERQAIKSAAKIAGLEALRIVNEPVAVVHAHGLNEVYEDMKVLIFDFGGVTCDVTLLSIEDGVSETLASASDSSIGGERITDRLVERLVSAYEIEIGALVPTDDSEDISKLRRYVEQAKRFVSQRFAWQEIHEIPTFEGEDGYITQWLLESLSEDLFAHSIDLVDQVLEDANVTKEEVDKIILAGGSSRIAKVQDLLQEHFAKEPTIDINPEKAAVRGAAIYGNKLRFVQPDACCCCDWPLWPHQLGIETCDGIVKYIPVLPVVPFRRTYNFSTFKDDQTSVRIGVYSGERPYAKDNLLIESFELKGIAPAPRGVSQIEVTFEIDSDFYLQVSALDRAT
ncbi:HSP70-domain-containing protein [Coniophora puteana RWD-64-598 SS2]|uniref:HSP70-domain-containing protein n=1 Tax=Coniophora puteana (strain RWD-64-598) TaxID=741705 RepID=A0A5M3MLQ5_CONPW|nr:HSP70-domain-containing protein [Coniophora puteana RWD-64-598 SS2]EIW79714.1 HSP70-domain-containing protein [Coniophora puteana RWD-64-598 SS2]